ncbi:MAG: von Willebrand factor type A domain-containing protein [Chryseolinea sp.]
MKTMVSVLAAVFILASSFMAPETRTITGKVTDANGATPIQGVNVTVKGTQLTTFTNVDGKYSIVISQNDARLIFNYIGYQTQEIKIGSINVINVKLQVATPELEEIVISEDVKSVSDAVQGRVARVATSKRDEKDKSFRAAPSASMIYGNRAMNVAPQDVTAQPYNTEAYNAIEENIFHDALKNPLSTFSIDVDAASYSNVRRFINGGQRPPKDAVRIEEMINYFDYDYAQPHNDDPFAVNMEISSAPWNEKHKLVQIGIQGRIIPMENLPASNIVFLLDVSGSMGEPNKLPLLKSSLKMLVEQLREQDHVAIVVYAGAAGLVLEPTSGSDKKTIIDALDHLEAGGSTAGGEGINLAYAVAKEHFKANGNNRIILATDGDFNIGESSDASMERLIEQKRKDGIFLTVLGYGMGNYKDSKMETLADKGNGNYAYIDNISEARKVLVNEFGGTLFTIAKDVKIQVEFNPALVQAYRLVGYENRVMKNEEFNDDKKDAGELGSGHTVTALYEIVPAGVEFRSPGIDALKYQTVKIDPKVSNTKELMTVKLRYKKPNEDVSKLIVHPLVDNQIAFNKTSDNFRWAASVASFGMLLRESEFVKDYTFYQVIKMAEESKGADKEGYRMEFINMVRSMGAMARR